MVENEPEDFKGFINRMRRRVISLARSKSNDFHEGLAAGQATEYEYGNISHKWGYIDTSGKLVIKPVHEFADDFSESLAAGRDQDLN